MKHSSKWLDVVIYTALFLFSVSTVVPFIYITIVSFTDPHEFITTPVMLFPHSWSIASYRYILSSNQFVNSLLLTTALTIVGTVCALLVTSGLAYGLSRRRLKGRNFILTAILFTMLFNPGIMPNYLLIRNLGLLNSFWALVLPGLATAFYVLLMKSFFQDVPAELEESGKIDGCSDVGIFFRIILPISLPVIAAFSLFYGVGYWNTYFGGVLYINKDTLRPLQVVLQQMLSASSAGADYGESSGAVVPTETVKMAAVVLAAVPIVMVYPFLQKYFVKGLTLGSVKG
ncbi:carbohydrate ABC transporter permease [Paenibacillus sp. Soil787]|uniref:carbohydrate ABC transporter permease n=1 Tax=Paenibacillus sp. Soil787 TaxID=1736411 RepID=UPI0006F58284|nr:carbohydrate ABC transporter permease [Paenibacillus sp. Soil787]KRF43713.1 ABC transporter permease [Paenibacillus sp. Soil787]